jgi:exopolysaccharide biosynthesis protein
VVADRRQLADGAVTSLYVAAFPLDAVTVRVARLPEGETLLSWCGSNGIAHAIVGGFFVRSHNKPLGELQISGQAVGHVPFTAPWGAQRACVHVGPDGIRIARRSELAPRLAGDLLQAGPLLVRDGASALTGGDDEGFSAGADQFDSDISEGRHPRAALALADGHLLAVACDGRHHDEAGMTLDELADTLVELGAHAALNLDGGGSTSLVCHGRLVNQPREEHGIELAGGRPISTALVLSHAG